jgi:small-conductance mechanosensitive channel
MGSIWEVSLGDFLLVTLFLGGGAAYLTGRAVAGTWRPYPKLIVYLLLLAAAVRFIHYALFGGTLLSPQFYVADLVILLILGTIGYRVTRAGQMTSQYGWLYERSGPFSWRARRAPERDTA